jgi:hypothetical protein
MHESPSEFQADCVFLYELSRFRHGGVIQSSDSVIPSSILMSNSSVSLTHPYIITSTQPPTINVYIHSHPHSRPQSPDGPITHSRRAFMNRSHACGDHCCEQAGALPGSRVGRSAAVASMGVDCQFCRARSLVILSDLT